MLTQWKPAQFSSLSACWHSATVLAQAYRWVDEDGIVHYSDVPTEGAEGTAVRIFAQYRRSPVSREGPEQRSIAEEPADDQPFRYESLVDFLAWPEETLWNIDGVLNVSVAVEPGPAERPPAARVLQRPAATGERHELSDRGSVSRRAQPAGGSHRRNGPPDDSQRDEPLLCAAELGDHGRTIGGPSVEALRRQRKASTKNPQRILDSLSSGVILLDKSLVDRRPESGRRKHSGHQRSARAGRIPVAARRR